MKYMIVLDLLDYQNRNINVLDEQTNLILIRYFATVIASGVP